ncbi:TVP38/TMEM64 family protein [Pseudonocardia humida]|uniref:TVP38/TMEM64 family membrane protein n=1 Tax=Pseudonocardia humida TaxID=2800819 RepID=A0ABT0ZT73_9PSEU|nr:VTT domain-containing protein [Pseudonocardia humida]MCO1653933.1 TVP38/TMEM64 family protein [Pseudonocardia humida]
MIWRRVGAGLALLAVAALAAYLLRDGVPNVRQTVAAAGFWAPLLFVLLHGVICAGPVPRSVFTVVSGILFGSVTGVLAALAGTALAAGLAFVLAKAIGARLVERHAHRPPVAWVLRRVQHRGLLTMISLRLIPPMPFSVMNYASALSGAGIVPYLLATVIGVLPGTISIVVLGDAAVSGDPHPAMFVVSAVSGLIGLTGAYFVARRPLPAEPEPPAEIVDTAATDPGDGLRSAA